MEYKSFKNQNGCFSSNWADFTYNWAIFRKGYARWKLAIKRGHDVSLSIYFDKDGNLIKYVKLKASKGMARNRFNRTLSLALATPKWVNPEDLFNIYKNQPKGYHVDHIIPLKHDQVCGLHVPWNLQYLSKSENSKKGNRIK